MSLEGRDTMDVPALVNVIKALFARRGLFAFQGGPAETPGRAGGRARC